MWPRLKLVAANVAVLIALLVVIEGAVSYALAARKFSRHTEFTERRHVRPDPLLGWVNERSIHRPDLYGPGRSLTINSQGFRSARDFALRIPSGRYRIVCSGDSFTLGYGVDDADPWCAQLEALDPRIESVNMGQGGYGLDQAYLWYERDAAAIEHQLHLVAFIVDDISRMTEAEFNGYPKPLLTLDGGTLTRTGVPVPAPPPPWIRRTLDTASQLRTVEALRGIGRRLGIDGARKRPGHANDDETRAVVTALLAALQQLDRERHSDLVLVELPVDFGDQRDPHDWAAFVEQQARALGIPLLQLANAFQDLSATQHAAMFFQEGQEADPGAEGHYTAAGNARVAQLIYEGIKDRVAAPR